MFKFNSFESSLRSPGKLSIKPNSPFLNRKFKPDSKLTGANPLRQKSKSVSNQVSSESLYERTIDSGLESLSSNSSSDTVDCEVPGNIPVKPVEIIEARSTDEKFDKTAKGDDMSVNGSVNNAKEEAVTSNDVVNHAVQVVHNNNNESDSRKTNPADMIAKSIMDQKSVVYPASDLQSGNKEEMGSEKLISEDSVFIACSDINKTNIVLQTNSARVMDVSETGEIKEETENQCLVISLKDESENIIQNTQEGQSTDGKVTVKVVGEILKKDNTTSKSSVRSVEKSQSLLTKPSISEMILTSEILLKSPKCSERKVMKKNSQPIVSPQGKVQVARKTSEPAYSTQKTSAKLPLNRKTSHDETKSPMKPPQNPPWNSPKPKVQALGISKPSTSSSSLESLQMANIAENGNLLEAWETQSNMSEASTVDGNESQHLEKMKKNLTEEELKNLRKRRIERNIAHNNSKSNIVSTNISKFQNEIEKMKSPVSRKTSVEKLKQSRTDSNKKENGETSERQSVTVEQKPNFKAKPVFKSNAKFKSSNKSSSGNGGLVNFKSLKSWSSTITIEQALDEASSRRNGSQFFKDMGEFLVKTENEDELLDGNANKIVKVGDGDKLSQVDAAEPEDVHDVSLLDAAHIAPEAKSEEQLASEKSYLEADHLWLVHRGGFTRVRPLPSPSSGRDGKLKVKVEGSGVELTVDEDDVEKCNPAQYDTAEDICSARHLNESSVLHTLRCRYSSNLIHTYAGSTVLIVNPVAPLAIYSDKVAQLFKGCSSEDMPAHIYSVAQSAYRSLLSSRRDHALVFLGRAGSGKTYSYQHALRYLALTADSVNKVLTTDKLNAIWIVLEAFGHARTCLNMNTTRVSHIFSLDFDMTGAIASASIQLLLLDKQRVVRRPEGEGNYHVFYRLLSGADGTLRKELMLDALTSGEGNQFITPFTKHEDKQRALMDFVRLTSAMTTLGITEFEMKCLFSMLAAVLHLGVAGVVKGSSSGKWQFQVPTAAQRASSILGLPLDVLTRALFSPPSPTHTPGGTREFTGSELLECFAINLYTEAFNSVGALVNRSLSSSSHTVCSLLLLDTPGFQNPSSTGLNQMGAGLADFCFNYLQERLSLLFHHTALVSPKDLYAQENIDIPAGLDNSDLDDEFTSPGPLVSLLDNIPYNSSPLGPSHFSTSPIGPSTGPGDRKPPGLLLLLDELAGTNAGSPPGGSAGAPSFPDLVFGNFSEKEYHGLLRKAPGANHFIVQHNLGTNPVLYNTESWSRQIREPTTSRSLVSLLTESSNKDLAALLANNRGSGLTGSGAYEFGTGGTMRGVTSLRRSATGGFAKRRSVPLQVKYTVDSLIETIRRSQLKFVHCLLPHHNAGLIDPRSLAQNSVHFDSLINVPLLRSQLRGAQILSAARFHKLGYPRHLPLSEFRRRFALLGPCDSSTQPSESVNTVGDSAVSAQSKSKGVAVLDEKAVVDEILGCLDLDLSSYRVGLSQIFFRSHVLPQLEAERDKKLSSRVVAFQAQCRGYLARKHLAKLKVQDVAVRCIQRNVKKFMDVRDWSWWRLYLKIHPILNVHRTDQELQAKTEELEALKSKLEKLEVERNILKQDNARLESKLGEITEDYADEHSTASLATERLNIECSERSRLEKELAEAQTTNKKLQDTSDKLEAEVQCLRATDALSLDEGSEEDGGVFKKKYERAMRELELTKHRLTTQHQDDLEQLVALRKQLESKLSDAYEQIEEQRSVTSEWKRKVARINSEMSDLRLALEEQSSRNNLLEKKQRKFDAEFSMLQDELRQERNLKEKAMRDKELALGDKYTVEQTMSSLKLELELKEQKLSSLQQELEELTFSGNTEEEVANLKKKKHALEAKITDQEEELDELAGQVQMLEQAKLKVEMSLEQLRKAHRKELASKDEELESLRCSTQKKVKALQCQLDSEHESRTQLLRERHELERRLNTLEDMGVASQAADAETNQRLKRDLKRTKALLKDTQSMLAQARQDNPNKLLLRQLRNQLEDAELGRSAATKAKLGLEGDLTDLATSLDETQRARQEAETRLSEVQRERGSLQSMLDETEEEMTEVLKKYQASVAQLSTEQSNLQEATTRISELESENAAYKSQLSDLNARLETIETHGDPSSTLALKRLQLKSKELESKLEFEHTTRSRLEVQISRLKETTDKLQSECNILRSKESSSSNDSRKLQRQIRELKETIQALEAKGINESMKRKELEKEVQCREAEISSLKNELSVASQRIQDLQHAIQGDLDDDDDSDSDASSDQDQDPSSDEEYNSQLDDDGYDSKDTLRSSSDVGR